MLSIESYIIVAQVACCPSLQTFDSTHTLYFKTGTAELGFWSLENWIYIRIDISSLNVDRDYIYIYISVLVFRPLILTVIY